MIRKEKSIVKTGIKGFDELIQGGFPRGKIILLSGSPGTGKTIFGLQYLYNGATMFNEKGLYISFEEKAGNLFSQARQFGWDFEGLQDKRLIKFVEIPVCAITETTPQDILSLVKREKYDRIVIDSLSALAINVPTTYTKISEITDYSVKRFMYSFITQLREIDDATPILVSQTCEGELSRDGVSEFICDGIVLINYESMGGAYSRSIIVRKMREIQNNEDIHPLAISEEGMVVHELE